MVCTVFMSLGNLKNFLKSRRFNGNKNSVLAITLVDFNSMAQQIASACSYLEKQHVVHTSISAKHVLVDNSKNDSESRFHVCLFNMHTACDIEESSIYQMNVKSNSSTSVRWLSPEAIRDLSYSIKSGMHILYDVIITLL